VQREKHIASTSGFIVASTSARGFAYSCEIKRKSGKKSRPCFTSSYKTDVD